MACCVDDLFNEEKDKFFNHHYYLKFRKPDIKTALNVMPLNVPNYKGHIKIKRGKSATRHHQNAEMFLKYKLNI